MCVPDFVWITKPCCETALLCAQTWQSLTWKPVSLIQCNMLLHSFTSFLIGIADFVLQQNKSITMVNEQKDRQPTHQESKKTD